MDVETRAVERGQLGAGVPVSPLCALQPNFCDDRGELAYLCAIGRARLPREGSLVDPLKDGGHTEAAEGTVVVQVLRHRRQSSRLHVRVDQLLLARDAVLRAHALAKAAKGRLFGGVGRGSHPLGCVEGR